ncbi:MAG: GldG family protein [Bacteroidota bacterium]|nr:GldG family protein [Bacteroidota bacterium]
MKSRKKLIYTFLVTIGVLIVVNVLSNMYFFRLDFTADKIYSLSKATKKILKELKEPVTVTAYITKDLPPDLINTSREFKDVVVEYSSLSKNKIRYEFVNPSDNDENEQKALKSGVQPVVLNVRDKDEVKQQKVYLGAVVKIGNKTEIIPVIQQGAAMEYALSAAIKKLTITNKPAIGILQGHGEPGLSAIHQIYSNLDVLYNVQPVYLNDSVYNLNQYKTLLIIGPRDSIPAKHFQQIDRYLSEGGNLCIAATHVDGNFQSGIGYVLNNGLEKWLKGKGINLGDKLIVDANCGTVGAQQDASGMVIQVKFPYLPVITNFEKHPVTEGLEAVLFQFACPITYTGDASRKFEVLATTSDKTGEQIPPAHFDIDRQWEQKDFPLRNLVVAASLIPKNGREGKMIVMSNANFVINGEGQQAQPLPPDNINLFVNSVDWLSDDTGLIDLRTKGVTSRMLKPMEDGEKMFLKYLNFLLPIVVIIIYGIYRANRNRALRVKRMQSRFV